MILFFFQAEDGIRDLVRSRGLGDVYKRQEVTDSTFSFQADGNEYKFMYNYYFNGDTLVVKMQNNKDQVFHMLKK